MHPPRQNGGTVQAIGRIKYCFSYDRDLNHKAKLLWWRERFEHRMHRANLKTAHHSAYLFFAERHRQETGSHRNRTTCVETDKRKVLPSQRVFKGMRRGHTSYLWYASIQHMSKKLLVPHARNHRKQQTANKQRRDTQTCLLGWPLISHLRLSPEYLT